MLIGRRRKQKRSHEREASWRLQLEYLEDRLALSGGLDPSFDVDGKLTIPFDLGGTNDDEARAVLAQPDGKSVAVGFAASSTGDLDFAVTRTLPDGQPDFAFDSDGKAVVSFDLGGTNDDQAFAAALQFDGKIVIAGRAAVLSEADIAIVRLTPDGLLDDTFDFDGKQTIAFDLGGAGIDEAFGVTVDSFGRIVVAGRAETGMATFDIAIARLNADGSPDSTFSGNGKQTVALDLGGSKVDVGRSLTVQRDGTIVVAGRAELPGGDFDMAVIRLDDGGSLDPTFDQDGVQIIAFDLGGANEDNATSIALQTNGAIVLVVRHAGSDG